VVNRMISASDVRITNSIVTGVIFTEYSEEAIMENARLDPKGLTSRAKVAAVLMRYWKAV